MRSQVDKAVPEKLRLQILSGILGDARSVEACADLMYTTGHFAAMAGSIPKKISSPFVVLATLGCTVRPSALANPQCLGENDSYTCVAKTGLRPEISNGLPTVRTAHDMQVETALPAILERGACCVSFCGTKN